MCINNKTDCDSISDWIGAGTTVWAKYDCEHSYVLANRDVFG